MAIIWQSIMASIMKIMSASMASAASKNNGVASRISCEAMAMKSISVMANIYGAIISKMLGMKAK